MSLLLGGAVSASTLSGVLAGCGVDRSGTATAYTPQTFTATQDELVATIAELIIPETDTPGARAARVNEFIDLMLTDWYKPHERDHFLAGLGRVDTRAQQDYGDVFVNLTAEDQTALLTALEEEAIAYAERREERTAYDEFGREVDRSSVAADSAIASSSEADTTRDASDETDREPANVPLERQQMDQELEEAIDTPFFNMMKELTLAGYYTSEIGGAQELRDMPFGRYDGAVPFSEIGRAWS